MITLFMLCLLNFLVAIVALVATALHIRRMSRIYKDAMDKAYKQLLDEQAAVFARMMQPKGIKGAALKAVVTDERGV